MTERGQFVDFYFINRGRWREPTGEKAGGILRLICIALERRKCNSMLTRLRNARKIGRAQSVKTQQILRLEKYGM
jgi:hypothetical protein